jgi:hypothetical protein
LGRFKYHAPPEKCTTHGEGSDLISRTAVTSRPRDTGVEKAAWVLRLGPTVYDLCSFRLEDSLVTSVTVQMRFTISAVHRPRRLGNGGARNRSRPRGQNSFPRCNEPSRTDCGDLRPSYKARHRAGSSTKHRARKVPHTASEANKHHAPKTIAVRETRGSRRRPWIFGWDPRSIRYSPFV